MKVNLEGNLMVLHKILLRQLNRYNLDSGNLPSSLDEWQSFLESINKKYKEEDQERYLLERSMTISSQELSDLNKRLESAQEIAQLGYWLYKKGDTKITLSKGVYNLLKPKVGSSLFNFHGFLSIIYKEDRLLLVKGLKNSLLTGQKFELEIRIKQSETESNWYFIIAHPFKDNVSFYNSFTGILMDINKRKKAEEELIILHNQLVMAERQAGMTDIATATLHNVGNILNSANVTCELLKEMRQQSARKKLYQVATLLQNNLSKLNDYLSTDPQGQLIPEYLLGLIENINKEEELYVKETENLHQHIAHIKEIITIQNDMNRSYGVCEKVSIPQTVDLAIEMATPLIEKQNIRVVKNYQPTPKIMIDKIKLMQILTNIIQNAQDAFDQSSAAKEKTITICVYQEPLENKVIIKVKDNGMGILPENLVKIFSLRFTTKIKGHGFGLHMCALDVKSMGGNLVALSEGQGKGATFVLTLPLEKKTPTPTLTT